jgi:hypothetical protein
MIALRVTPSRMSSLTGGVSATPSRTTNRLAAEASLTWPSAVRTIASSKPFSSASDFWKAMFT